MTQQTIFDQAERAKQQGIEAVWQHANSIWKRRASEVLNELIEERRYITSEDIIKKLDAEGLVTSDNRAIGALMQAAKRVGLVSPTDTWKTSSLKRRHKAPIRVWESLRSKNEKRI